MSMPHRTTRLHALLAVAAAVCVASSASHADGEWRTEHYPGLVVRYHPRNADAVPDLVNLIADARAAFEAVADTSPAVTINVLVAASEAEFDRLTEGYLPDWGAAVAFPEQRLIIMALLSSGKSLDQVMRHEVSHIMLGALAREPVPRWFDEGLAMYLADEWSIYDSFRLARGALTGELIPLPRIDFVLSFHSDRAWLAYTESFGAVTTLSERMSREEFAEVLRALDKRPFDEALAVVTNIRRTAFEEEWLSGARRRYALVTLADDMWIWTVLLPGLFFLALVAMWWRNRRTVARWAAEGDDGYDDDDDEPDEPLDERIAETYG